MSYSQVLDLLVISHNITSVPGIVYSSQQEDCPPKMIYLGRKMVMELDLCASSKYIQILREEAGDGADNKELVTSAGAELRKSVVMVLQIEEQAVQAFLSSVSQGN